MQVTNHTYCIFHIRKLQHNYKDTNPISQTKYHTLFFTSHTVILWNDLLCRDEFEKNQSISLFCNKHI